MTGVYPQATPTAVEIADRLDDIPKNVRIKVTSLEARQVVDEISQRTGIPVDSIVIGRGSRAACHARQLVYAELRRRGASYCRIGWLMDRDHSTVMYGVRKVLG